ncbi:hypothetical protein X975_21901, partial [Stegodyphus mimosarum]
MSNYPEIPSLIEDAMSKNARGQVEGKVLLFMDQSSSVGEDETEFDDMPEDIMEDEYIKVFMLSNNENFKIHKLLLYFPSECIISPERTPPPPSPEKPTWPFIEETLNLVKQTFQESPILELTNFAAVLEKTEKTRKSVARMFYHLLHMEEEEIKELIKNGDCEMTNEELDDLITPADGESSYCIKFYKVDKEP